MKSETITMDEYGRVTVTTDTANVWMNEAELLDLFGVIAPTLRAAIKTIYRSGVLKHYEAKRYIKLPNSYGMDVYALPMVVALVFRINSPYADKVRNALLERLCLRKEKQVMWVSLCRQPCEC